MRYALMALVIAGASCVREEPPESLPPTVTQPVAWAFDAPATWDDRVRLEDDSIPGLHATARVFTYQPSDTSARPQALLGIVVFDSAAWVKVRADEGPPPGDSLAAVRGSVFVASLPQSNPFAPASVDGRAFDSLAVDLAAVRRAFRVLQE